MSGPHVYNRDELDPTDENEAEWLACCPTAICFGWDEGEFRAAFHTPAEAAAWLVSIIGAIVNEARTDAEALAKIRALVDEYPNLPN